MGKGKNLHDAARSGDLSTLQSICSSNPSAINSRDKHSRTPLHLAAWAGQAQVVSYLCKNNADVGAAAMDDMGAIHFAAQKGHLEVVRLLLSSGVSVKSCTRKGMTALHYAVQGSHLELVKFLVKKGANLHAKNKAGKTPLDVECGEEVRLFLAECEKGPQKGEPKNEKSAGDQLETTTQEKAETSDAEAAVSRQDEAEGKEYVKTKRKGDESEIEGGLPQPKKAKVALNHLLASDDTQEEED